MYQNIKNIIFSLAGLKVSYIQPKVNNDNYNKAQSFIKQILSVWKPPPMIQQLVEATSAVMTFLYVSLGCYQSLTLERCLSLMKFEALFYAELSQGPISAFQSGWGLDFAWIMSPP